MSFTVRSTIALLVAVTVPAVGSVAAQEESTEESAEPLSLDPIPPEQLSGPIPVPDGDYTGTLGLSGRFTLTFDGVKVVWSGEAGGPIAFSVVDSQLTGTWSMDGIASVDLVGGPVQGVSAAAWSTVGTITASGSGPYVMSSEAGDGLSTATVDVPGLGPQSRTEAFTIPAATAELDRVVEVCGQISANWDQTIQAGLSQLPAANGSVRTYLTALPEGVSEIQEQIDELLEQASELTADMSDVDQVVARMYLLVYDAEQLLEQIEPADLPCDADGAFMRIVTLQIQDALHTLLTSWDELGSSPLNSIDLLRRLLVAGGRAGAIGSGAADPIAAELLESLAAEIAQEAFLEAVTSDGLDTDRITELALIGLALEIDYVGPDGTVTSPSDLCLALGGCS